MPFLPGLLVHRRWILTMNLRRCGPLVKNPCLDTGSYKAMIETVTINSSDRHQVWTNSPVPKYLLQAREKDKGPIYLSALVATTGYQTGWPKQQKCIFLIILEARSPTSRCQQGWFLGRPLFLAHRHPLSCCFLTWPLLYSQRHLVSLPLFKWIPVLSDQAPCLGFHLIEIIFSKVPLCKYSHIGWLGLQHMNLQRHSSVLKTSGQRWVTGGP